MSIALFGGSLLKRIQDNGCLDGMDLGTEHWYLNPLDARSNKISFDGEEYLLIELSSVRLKDDLLGGGDPLTDDLDQFVDSFKSFCENLLVNFAKEKIVLLSSSLPAYYERKGVVTTTNNNESRFHDRITILEQLFLDYTGIYNYLEPNKIFFLSKNLKNESSYFFDYEKEYYNYLKYDLKRVFEGDSLGLEKKKNSILYSRFALYFGKISYARIKNTIDENNPGDVLAFYTNTTFVEKNLDKLTDISIESDKIKNYPDLNALYNLFKSILEDTVDWNNIDLSLLDENFFIMTVFLGRLRGYLKRFNFPTKLITKNNYIEYINCYIRNIISENQIYNKPVLVDIWGSCISRSMVNYTGDRIVSNVYYMHLNQLNYYQKCDSIDYSKLDRTKWEANSLYIQLEGSAEEYYGNSDSEWLLLDFYSLISEDIWKAQGKSVTVGYETGVNYFGVKPDKNNSMFLQYSEDEVCEKLQRFVDFCKRKYGDKIILFSANHSYYKMMDESISEWDDIELLRKKNNFISKIEKWFWNQTGCYYLDLAKRYISSDRTVYNMTPFHQDQQLYVEQAKIVEFILNYQPEQRFFDRVNIGYYLDVIYYAKQQKLGMIVSSGVPAVDACVELLSPQELLQKRERIAWLYNSKQYTE